MDKLEVVIRGGAGGVGIPHRGGVGGEGGDVVIKAHERASLLNIQRKYPKRRIMGRVGGNSRKVCIYGEKGATLTINVPVGVSIHDEEKRLIKDLNEDGEEYLVAEGGAGAAPSNGFTAVVPPERLLHLDLKLMADVGLVGFPNAGKSTLLKALSRASPKIASYPFTTVKPQVGMLSYPDQRKISMADLPGLIEGASQNVGMGCDFLKHTERTLLLLFIIDIHGFQLKSTDTYYTAMETLVLLNKELELYDPDLLNKPALLCLNKCHERQQDAQALERLLTDLENLEERIATLPEIWRPSRLLEFKDTFEISAKHGTNLPQLKDRIRHIIDVECYEPKAKFATGVPGLYQSRSTNFV